MRLEQDAIRVMDWEGPSVLENPNLDIISNQGRVSPATGEIENGKHPTTHPLVSGRRRTQTAIELASTGDLKQPIDWVVFRSVSRMDAGE